MYKIIIMKDNKEVKFAEQLEKYLKKNQETQEECQDGVCVIKSDNAIVERVNKKIIIEDGRQLLI